MWFVYLKNINYSTFKKINTEYLVVWCVIHLQTTFLNRELFVFNGCTTIQFPTIQILILFKGAKWKIKYIWKINTCLGIINT